MVDLEKIRTVTLKLNPRTNLRRTDTIALSLNLNSSHPIYTMDGDGWYEAFFGGLEPRYLFVIIAIVFAAWFQLYTQVIRPQQVARQLGLDPADIDSD